MLPEWVVIPRAALSRLFVVGTLLGASLAFSVAGFIAASSMMLVAFPCFLVALRIVNAAVSWPDERIAANLSVTHPDLATTASTSVARGVFGGHAFELLLGLIGLTAALIPSAAIQVWPMTFAAAAVALGAEGVMAARKKAARSNSKFGFLSIILGGVALAIIMGRMNQWF
jgi:hypothetical protein